MEARPVRQRNLVLILARDLADKLATPVFVVDHEGTLVYFNDACEQVLGMTFAEAGFMRMNEWAGAFSAADFQDRPLSQGELPLVRAIRERQPAHLSFRIRAADDEVREIAVTALPLFAEEGELVGGMAVFWERPMTEVGEVRGR
jgi:PAS domain-containing protein